MSIIKVGGFDPSMKNFGMIKGQLDLATGVLTNLELKLQESSIDKEAKGVRKNSQDLDRARKLYKAMTEFFSDTDVVCVEMPVGSQSANAMKSYAMCVTLTATLTPVVIQVTPSEVKLVATNSKTASKADMINWATKQYPDADWLRVKRKGVMELVDKNEHLADALGALHSGVKTDQFKQIRLGYMAK
jgi:hypothetical protein